MRLIYCLWVMWEYGRYFLKLPCFNKVGRPVLFRTACKGVYRTRSKLPWVRQEVLYLKALMPQAGCRQIALVFNRRFQVARQESVSKSFVAYTLRRHEVEIRRLRDRIRHRVPRAEPRNRTWGIDMTGKGDEHGMVHSILGMIDHGSRRILSLQVLRNKNAWTLLGYVFLAIGRFGRPRAIRTDNERVLTSRVFMTVLRFAGIRHQRTVPGCPWMNGRIERFFGTLKEQLNTIVPVNGVALQGMLTEFSSWYNRVRPHQHLTGATPEEAWQGIHPYINSPRKTIWFEAWEGRLTGFYMQG